MPNWVMRCGWGGFLVFFTGCLAPIAIKVDGGLTQTKPIEAAVRADLSPYNSPDPFHPVVLPGTKGQKRVAIIELDGVLVQDSLVGLGSQGSNPVVVFHEKLQAAEEDPLVVGVVLRINSPGGTVSASDIVAGEVRRFRDRTGKKVVAHILETGTGGAYLIASASNRITASPGALVGGIGVVFPVVLLEKMLDILSITDQSIKSGELIDMGTASRKMEPSEREMMEAMAKEHHDRFKAAISISRKIPEKLLDGRIMTATMAQSGGLVDEICSLNDAVALASGRTDKNASPPQEVEVVLYRKGLETARSVYDTIPNQPLQATALPLSIPGLDRTRQGGFWYLWMSDPTLTRLTGK
ncbi:MAG: S49 family peptidase [Gemmataceae bacterium]|nr:S49 family peptidase [Gemmataceae bacterium]